MKRNTGFIVLAVAMSGLAACAKQAPVAAAPAAPPPEQFKLAASVLDLMLGQIDPAADAVWDSVAISSSAKGPIEKKPQTDAEWKALRLEALRLIEATNLLQMEGRQVALPGQDLEEPATDGVLTPAQSQAAIAANRQTFIAFARALQDSALLALAAIDKHDSDALLEVGGIIDEACEQCHKQFWYPDQPAAVAAR